MEQHIEEILTANTVTSSIESLTKQVANKEDTDIHTGQLKLHQERIELIEYNSDRLESYIINLSKYAANLKDRADVHLAAIRDLTHRVEDLQKQVTALQIVIILLILLIYL